MEDSIRNIFVACDRDKDGYLDRTDLEEVCREIGLEVNLSDILAQCGAKESGKISYKQFCSLKTFIMNEMNTSSSESSPEYSTDNEQGPVTPERDDRLVNRMESESQRLGKQEPPTMTDSSRFMQPSALDLELQASGAKMKEIQDAWPDVDPNVNPHRRSGGGIEDYLDAKTLQHLEKLQLIDPQPAVDKVSGFAPRTSAFATVSQPPAKSVTADSRDMRDARGIQPDYLELTNRLHLAALTSYKNEIGDLTSRLQRVTKERDRLLVGQNKFILEKQKLQKEYEEKLQSQTMRITELQSVIAELTRKLSDASGKKIIEEEEEDDDDGQSRSTSDMEVQGSHGGSQCSCEKCAQILDEDGPNQVNYLALTTETQGSDVPTGLRAAAAAVANDEVAAKLETLDNDDLKKELTRVIGVLESTIADRKKLEGTLRKDGAADEDRSVSTTEQLSASPTQFGDAETVAQMKSRTEALLKVIVNLKEDKKNLEKQLSFIRVQGFMKSSVAGLSSDDVSKLQQDNYYLRAKLRKAEQEVEDVKTSNISIREERERLRRKLRHFQESSDAGGEMASQLALSSDLTSPSPLPASSSPTARHKRAHSLQTAAPSAHDVSQVTAMSPEMPHRSYSLDSRTLQKMTSLDGKRQRPVVTSTSRIVQAPNIPGSPFPSIRKGFSPEGSLRSGQHMDSSDLGSSIGDDIRSELAQTLIRSLRDCIPETLMQSILTYSNLEQVLHALTTHFISEVEDKRKEGLIELERLESRLAHLQSQNDLLQLSLDESKQHSEHLTMLCSKYESNHTAWALALQNTDQLIEMYEVMLQLQEAEADVAVANCYAAGIGYYDTLKSLTSTKSSHSNVSVASSFASAQLAAGAGEEEDGSHSLKQSHSRRKDAETQAKLLLHRLDKKYDNLITGGEEDLKHDELSYKSRTSTGSSQNSASTDTLSKNEELRLRDYIEVLKRERLVYHGTVIELESVHDVADYDGDKPLDDRSEKVLSLNQDLETAVILQEMQALKEERAELKHRIYLLEKEKRALELKINSQEAQEQAYIVHIEHLKGEVKEQLRKRKQMIKEARKAAPVGLMEDECRSMSSSSSTHLTSPPAVPTDQPNCPGNTDDIPLDLIDAARRERKLKVRIQELVEALEKLSKNSEIRHLQTAEYISDLKKANGALVTAYEKAKKRHASRLKKFEHQLVQMSDKYQEQVRLLKEKIASLEKQHAKQTETSL